MAQQQNPNDDAARGSTGQQGIVAGSQDTYRSPGFRSATVTPPATTPTATPAQPAAPTSGTWGKWSGAYTPGIQAAIGSGGSSQPGTPNKQGPIIGAIDALSFANFKPNNSQLQDIGGNIYGGNPVTDAMWANAGYGPGGVPLAAQPPATLGGSTLGGVLGSIVGQPAGSSLAQSAAIKYASPTLFGGAAP